MMNIRGCETRVSGPFTQREVAWLSLIELLHLVELLMTRFLVSKHHQHFRSCVFFWSQAFHAQAMDVLIQASLLKRLLSGYFDFFQGDKLCTYVTVVSLTFTTSSWQMLADHLIVCSSSVKNGGHPGTLTSLSLTAISESIPTALRLLGDTCSNKSMNIGTKLQNREVASGLSLTIWINSHLQLLSGLMQGVRQSFS